MIIYFLAGCATETDSWWNVPTGYTPPVQDTADTTEPLDVDTTSDQMRLSGSVRQVDGGAAVQLRYVLVDNGTLYCDVSYGSDKVRQVGSCGDCLVALSIWHSDGTVNHEQSDACGILGWSDLDGEPLYIGMNEDFETMYCQGGCDEAGAQWQATGEAIPEKKGFVFFVDL